MDDVQTLVLGTLDGVMVLGTLDGVMDDVQTLVLWTLDGVMVLGTLDGVMDENRTLVLLDEMIPVAFLQDKKIKRKNDITTCV
jgi:hypothetical protein